MCDWCGDYKTAGDLPRAILGDVPIDRIPIAKDSYVEPREWPDCAVCDNPAEEMHHWAPRAIFPDWPKRFGLELVVPLCKDCHKEWHDRMRAHGLRWPHEIGEAA